MTILTKVDEELQDKIHSIYFSIKGILKEPKISWSHFREEKEVDFISEEVTVTLYIEGNNIVGHRLNNVCSLSFDQVNKIAQEIENLIVK